MEDGRMEKFTVEYEGKQQYEKGTQGKPDKMPE